MGKQVVKDRIRETSTSTGAGVFALSGAVTGFRTFASVCAVGDWFYYVIEAVNADGTLAGAWEVGVGEYSAANQLTRAIVLSSSNADAAVNFAAGAKHIMLTAAAAQLGALENRRKNLIRNGDFQVTQRGNAIAGLTTAQYTLDGCVSGWSGTTTVSQQVHAVGQTDVPGSPKYFLQVDRTVAAGGANEIAGWPIEFPESLSGKTVTLGFWAAITVGGGTKEFHLDFLSSGVTPAIQTVAKPVTLDAVWRHYHYTTTIPAMTAATGAAYLRARVTELFVFETFTLRISDIQAEIGPGATPFERLEFWLQMRWNKRFLRKSFPPATAPTQNAGVAGSYRFGQVVGASASQVWGWVPFDMAMRLAPSVTLYNPSAANAQIRNENAAADGSSTTANNATEDGFLITGTTAPGSAAGQQNAIHWLASAEL